MKLLYDLFVAYYDARINKRNTINQLKFELKLEENLYQLYLDIKNRQYSLSPSIAFIVKEPTIREIFAATFRDRVVHHLVFNYINQFWDRQFIYDSYSCRVGRGTSFGHARMKRFLRAVTDNYTKEAWVLKLDILGYFMHIQRQIVWKKCYWGLQKQFANEYDRQIPSTLAYLLRIIIFADPTQNVQIKGKLSNWDNLPRSKSLFCAKKGYGFPIGNLTSQLFSNIYLHELDSFVKYKLGFKYYGRYVDDFILMNEDKNCLLEARREISEFLCQRLSLQLHPKKIYLQSARYGLDFLGGIIKPYYILPGKRLVNKFHLAYLNDYIEKKPQSWESYLGHLKGFQSWNLINRYSLMI